MQSVCGISDICRYCSNTFSPKVAAISRDIGCPSKYSKEQLTISKIHHSLSDNSFNRIEGICCVFLISCDREKRVEFFIRIFF